MLKRSTMPRKLTRNETAVARVAQLIQAGVVLVAHNALDHEDTSVGPYHEAVDRGYRFAVIGDKGRAEQRCGVSREHTTAENAAWGFVNRVGSTRANDAAKAAAKRRGIALLA
jgi:hypothetical protein